MSSFEECPLRGVPLYHKQVSFFRKLYTRQIIYMASYNERIQLTPSSTPHEYVEHLPEAEPVKVVSLQPWEIERELLGMGVASPESEAR